MTLPSGVPTFVLHPEVREDDEHEDGDDGDDVDNVIWYDYLHNASRLCQELMGMVQSAWPFLTTLTELDSSCSGLPGHASPDVKLQTSTLGETVTVTVAHPSVFSLMRRVTVDVDRSLTRGRQPLSRSYPFARLHLL